MRVYASDKYELRAAPGSRFPASKYRKVRERIDNAAGDSFLVLESPAIAIEDILLVHDKDYVDAFFSGDLSSEVQRRIGFPWSEALVTRTLHSMGGTIAASFAALEDGAAANLAGGTHHASYAMGGGYCVFNDLAIAARKLLERPEINSVLIVDGDVHQGDGTAKLMSSVSEVYTFSIHCADNYPREKATSDLDIPLLAGVGDDEYLRHFQDGLKRAMLASRPDVVLYQAGADAFEGDRLGHLALTKGGLKRRDELLFGACRRAFVPVAITLGGGYADSVDDIVDIHYQTIKSANEANISRSL